MPDKVLNPKQIENFKKKLMKMKEDLLYDVKNMSSANSTESKDAGSEGGGGHGLHMADVATDMYDREFTLGLASNDRELLKKINDALKRIEEGTFGFCLKTKKRIPLARLEAIPYAEYCLEVQEEMDKKK